MDCISKVPKPRGSKYLAQPINVSRISGPCSTYDDDGELKGRYTGDFEGKKNVGLCVIYTIKYNDNTSRNFNAYENVTESDRDFSLSKAPIIQGKIKYVVEICIEVRKIE